MSSVWCVCVLLFCTVNCPMGTPSMLAAGSAGEATRQELNACASWRLHPAVIMVTRMLALRVTQGSPVRSVHAPLPRLSRWLLPTSLLTHCPPSPRSMGFNDQEIVALNGAHTLGRCHSDRSGFLGPWTNGEGGGEVQTAGVCMPAGRAPTVLATAPAHAAP